MPNPYAAAVADLVANGGWLEFAVAADGEPVFIRNNRAGEPVTHDAAVVRTRRLLAEAVKPYGLTAASEFSQPDDEQMIGVRVRLTEKRGGRPSKPRSGHRLAPVPLVVRDDPVQEAPVPVEVPVTASRRARKAPSAAVRPVPAPEVVSVGGKLVEERSAPPRTPQVAPQRRFQRRVPARAAQAREKAAQRRAEPEREPGQRQAPAETVAEPHTGDERPMQDVVQPPVHGTEQTETYDPNQWE